MRRRRRQLQTRNSLPQLRSVILGNGDGLRVVETNARSGNVFIVALLTHFLKTCLVCVLAFSLFLLSAHPFARIRWFKHLVLQYVRKLHVFYGPIAFLFLFLLAFFLFFFLFFCFPFCSCAPGFAVCPCFIASYLSTLYVSYISPGAWCATKLL